MKYFVYHIMTSLLPTGRPWSISVTGSFLAAELKIITDTVQAKEAEGTSLDEYVGWAKYDIEFNGLPQRDC